jgi:hypothetical protein
MLSNLNPEFIYVLIAVMGGVARYLYNYINGQKFRLSVFLASAVVAGFSGSMFLLWGIYIGAGPALQGVMAGMGGFFGEQTMKLILELWTQRFGTFDNKR